MRPTLEQTASLLLAGAALTLPTSARSPQDGSSADRNIADYIREALIVDPRIASADVLVTVENGYVTLTGPVHTLAGKNYAIREAEKIAGVKGVEDKLNVATPWRPDTDIAQDVRHRIVNHSRIGSQGIVVTCKDGVVKLSGHVDAFVEESLAEELASETRGVHKVTNEIVLDYKPTRSDSEILEDVQAALQLDAYLTDLPIRATVTSGQVTLQGSTGSYFTQRRATSDVEFIPGVREVKNELEVRWNENEGARAVQPAFTDAELAEHVRHQLMHDARIDALGIEVKARSGDVTLLGKIPSSYEKRIAYEDARDTVGVAWITDKLLVGPEQRSDSAIRSDLLWEMDVDSVLSGADLRVNVRDGVVTLEGKLRDAYQSDHASDLAYRIRGVKSVVDAIDIVGEVPDKEIVDSLANRLQWNWRTSAVHDQIHFDVSGGVVTLSGRVDTWAQRAAALRVADGTPGVWRVNNRLQVGDYPYRWEQ